MRMDLQESKISGIFLEITHDRSNRKGIDKTDVMRRQIKLNMMSFISRTKKQEPEPENPVEMDLDVTEEQRGIKRVHTRTKTRRRKSHIHNEERTTSNSQARTQGKQ